MAGSRPSCRIVTGVRGKITCGSAETLLRLCHRSLCGGHQNSPKRSLSLANRIRLIVSDSTLTLQTSKERGSSAELPEVPGEPEPVQDGLVLLERVRAPIGRKTVAPSFLRELGELHHRDRFAPFAAVEPALDVLLRPEEVHRASGEGDVVPPVRGGDEAVKEEALVVWPVPADLDADLLPAVGT